MGADNSYGNSQSGLSIDPDAGGLKYRLMHHCNQVLLNPRYA